MLSFYIMENKVKNVVYHIINKETGQIYVGSTVNWKERKPYHLNELRNNKHHNHRLQKSWNEYGEDSFEFKIICKCKKNLLRKKEQEEIDKFLLSEWKIDRDKCFNIAVDASNPVRSNNRRFDDKQTEKICQLYRDGKSSCEIADKFDCTATTILEYLGREGVETRTVRQARGGLSDQQIEQVCQDYKGGLSSIQLSKKYGINKTTILRYLEKSGVPRRNDLGGGKEKKITDQHWEEIIALYKGGISGIKLAQKFPYSEQIIYRELGRYQERNGELPPIYGGAPEPMFTDEECKEITEKYESGLSSLQLADEYDCSSTTIVRAVERAGGEMRTIKQARSVVTDDQVKQICEDYRSGLSSRDLAKKYDVSRPTILRRLKKNGVKIRPSKRSKNWNTQ